MDRISTPIDSFLTQKSDPYTVTATLNEGKIDPNSTTITGTGSTDLDTTDSKNALGKMDFLKLLTTQLQYQDPLDPMENTQFVTQLAQFSSLEGTQNVEKAISGLDQSFKDSLTMQSYSAMSMTNASAVSLIGKRIRIAESSVKYTGIPIDTTKIRVHLGNSTSAMVKILDESGKEIRTFSATGKDAQNSVELTWDGKNDAGEYVNAGKYYVYIDGQDKDESLYCFVEDVVSGVRYGADGPMIKIAGKELPLGDIMDISMTESTNTEITGFTDLNALTLLGKTVKYQKPSVTYTPVDGKLMDLNINFGGYKPAIVQIKDCNGKVVHSFNAEAESGGTATIKMECQDFNGNGPYTVSLLGNTAAHFFMQGQVEGITTVDGITKAKVNGISVALSEIYEVSTSGKV